MSVADKLPLLIPAVLAVFTSAALGATDDAAQCGPGFRMPERPAAETTEPDAEPGTIRLSADAADVADDGVSRLTGNVRVEQGERLLATDELVYDQSGQVLEATGNVRFWGDGVFVAGDRARAEIEHEVIAVEPATAFMIEDEQGHGRAGGIRTVGTGRMTANDVTYTTCAPGDSGDADWRITASHVEFDRAEDTGVARNTWLEIEGQRVFYLPWISFPLSSQRKSGFLTPTWGAGRAGSVELTTPYYFNLAPTYDATLAARTMSDRGVQAQGELRFLSRTWGAGRLAAELLPHDAELGDDRTAFDLAHRHEWFDRWSTDARLEWVSDPEYLQDLGADLSQTSRIHLPRRVDASYRGDAWDALVRVEDFQTLDRTILPRDRPYARLPQILVRTISPERSRALNFNATAELAYFDQRSLTTGARVDVRPSLSYPIRDAGAFVTPKAALHYTGYNLDRTEAEASLDDQPQRVVPSFSLDGGVFFERPASLYGRPFTHTIEPRLYYLLVPYSRQDDMPSFDTSRSGFSFDHLFRENRFTGGDRMGDTSQLTLAATSRLLDERGGELARVSLGQIRYFRDRRVVLDEGGEPETGEASSLVAELEARPARKWRLRANLQYDTDVGRTDANAVHVRYQQDRRSVVNAAYRLVRNTGPEAAIEQADLSFAWPIGSRWRAVGRWSFALDDDDTQRTLEAFGGLAYESCCLSFRAVARRFLSNAGRIDDEDRYSNGLFFQLELKGLSGSGSRRDALFTRGIPGYENDF